VAQIGILSHLGDKPVMSQVLFQTTVGVKELGGLAICRDTERYRRESVLKRRPVSGVTNGLAGNCRATTFASRAFDIFCREPASSKSI
jgi:hypothetical protein